MPLRPFAPRLSALGWAGIAFLLLLVSLSGDSIDMMEAQTWAYAQQTSFSGFLDVMHSDTTQVSQMPLGMFSTWVWAQGFGTGELAMRSINLLWAAIALAAFARLGRQFSIPWLPLLFAIQPFVWYYMNYARTPLMQMAGGALLLAGAAGFLPRGKKSGLDATLLCVGGILLSGAHILGVLPVGAVACWLVLLGIWRKLRLSATTKALLFLSAAILAALAAYYATTLLRGHGADNYWSVSPSNLLFVAYEFLGFSGFGPGRQELRAIMKGLISAQALLAFIPGLLFLVAAYLVAFGAAAKSWMTREATREHVARGGRRIARSYEQLPAWLMGVAVPILSASVLFLLAFALAQPFWGRELAGAFPFWVLVLGITIHWARQGIWRRAGRLAIGIILACLMASSLLIRFAPWHKHDDYRGAATEAIRTAAEGKVVWWVADHSGAIYYGLPIAETITGAPGEIQFSMNRSEPGSPDAIIISRPDIFDSLGVATRLIESGSYQKTRSLQAFDVWEKAPAQ